MMEIISDFNITIFGQFYINGKIILGSEWVYYTRYGEFIVNEN